MRRSTRSIRNVRMIRKKDRLKPRRRTKSVSRTLTATVYHSHGHEGIPAVAPVSYAADAVKLRQHIDDEDQIEDVRSRYDTEAPSMASSSDSATEFEAFCSIDASLDASLDAA